MSFFLCSIPNHMKLSVLGFKLLRKQERSNNDAGKGKFVEHLPSIPAKMELNQWIEKRGLHTEEPNPWHALQLKRRECRISKGSTANPAQ